MDEFYGCLNENLVKLMIFVEIGVGINLWIRVVDVLVYGEWCVGLDNKVIYY